MKNIGLNILGIVIVAGLSGCMDIYDPKPVLAGYDGYMVTIRVEGSSLINNRPNQQQLQMAADACASYGWTGARYATTNIEPVFYRNDHKFICYR